MALTTYHHGITATETSNITPIIKSVSMSTIALVSTSVDADNTKYPLDTPVLLTGITTDDVTKAGAKDTLLSQCLQTIKSIQNTNVVVLRLSEPVDIATVDTLLSSQSRLGVTPKILIAPEIDTPTMTRKLVEIAKKRRGFVYASPRMEDGSLITAKEDIVAYRDTFAARELMLIEGGFGVPGKSNAPSLPDGGGETDFTTLPVNGSVTIDNSDGTYNNQTSDFSIEVNGVLYNADKSQDITGLNAPDLYSQISIYRSSDGSISFSPMVAGPLEVRLSPSDAQKAYSDTYLSGEGAIEADGTFAFKLGAI